MTVKKKLIDRDISWLSFNERVLQEAADSNVPLIERLRFLGIFSSNLDEFFRVRVASIKRIADLKRKSTSINTAEAKKILNSVKEIVIEQQIIFDDLYQNHIKPQLKKENIDIIDETELTISEKSIVNTYFENEVSPQLFPIILDPLRPFPNLRDGQIYLAVKMKLSKSKFQYAIVNIPTRSLQRFFVLKQKKSEHYKIILLEDIIRLNIDKLFKGFTVKSFELHTIKLSRDAELDIENTTNASLVDQLSKSLKLRKKGSPTRFIYDKWISADFLKLLMNKLQIQKNQAIPGGKYHNFKDFIKFPDLGHTDLIFNKIEPHYVTEFETPISQIDTILKQDVLIAFPYQNFNYIPQLLREAALNPNVTEINATLYRLADMSNVANALINAVRNGKVVKVLTELRARFMEEANIEWAAQLAEEGVQILNSIPNYKVHCKLFQIKIKQGANTKYIGHIGTGNFNESTAKLYCDFSLLTSNKETNLEISKVFKMLQNFRPANYSFQKLWVSPINTRNQLIALIGNEIKAAKAKKQSHIILKVNSLEDTEICNKLIDAINIGVKVELIVRGIFRLKLSETQTNVKAVSIIDRYLEHSRVFYFYAGGAHKMFMGSADIMKRNLDYRVEVTVPIENQIHKDILLKYLHLQLADNVKSRILINNLNNEYSNSSSTKIQSQIDFYSMLY